jgi:hypothetical protein
LQPPGNPGHNTTSKHKTPQEHNATLEPNHHPILHPLPQVNFICAHRDRQYSVGRDGQVMMTMMMMMMTIMMIMVMVLMLIMMIMMMKCIRSVQHSVVTRGSCSIKLLGHIL